MRWVHKFRATPVQKLFLMLGPIQSFIKALLRGRSGPKELHRGAWCFYELIKSKPTGSMVESTKDCKVKAKKKTITFPLSTVKWNKY